MEYNEGREGLFEYKNNLKGEENLVPSTKFLLINLVY